MNVLFTGFEPFGEVEYNPSWDCAQAAAETSDASARLLEVTFEAARSAFELGDFDLIVHFGVAISRDEICLERYAHNWCGERDEPLRRIDEAGPAARECTLPLAELADRLNAETDFRWRVSHDAGTYVCNATLYHALGVNRNAMFVHVPPVEAESARMIGVALARTLRTLLLDAS